MRTGALVAIGTVLPLLAVLARTASMATVGFSLVRGPQPEKNAAIAAPDGAYDENGDGSNPMAQVEVSRVPNARAGLVFMSHHKWTRLP